MPKTRIEVPKATREKVLKEYNYRCAICAADRPQIHHIDENPSNNDQMNLIPLCPNCHLTDKHNPTKPIDSEKLRLFREFKDPTILRPQFDPLFSRMKFLNQVDDNSDAGDLERSAKELVEFVAALEMGGFYSKRIDEILTRRGWAISLNPMYQTPAQAKLEKEQRAIETRKRFREGKQQVSALIAELLRFQKWQPDDFRK